MAFSVVRYVGNFVQTTFTLPFGYMITSHLTVTVGGVQKIEGVDYTVSGSTITFTTAPATGDYIVIRRKSGQGQLMTEYQDGITLTKGALTVDSTQAFYMAQEALDGQGSDENLNLSTLGSFYDARGQQIKNLATPTNTTDATTKAYVDAAVATFSTGSGYVQKAGDTMTGALTLAANPTTNLQAATKQYVDAGFVQKAGDTMTGSLTLAADPTTNLQAATKQYVDTGLASAGGAQPIGGFLALNILPASTYTWTQYTIASVNPNPGVNCPDNGLGSTNTKFFSNFNNRALKNAPSIFSVTTYSSSSPPPTAISFQVWCWYPIMFAKSMTLSYIGVDCQQSVAGAPWGQARLMLYSNNSTTMAPATMLVDGGIQTLPVTFSAPRGLGLWFNIPYTVQANTQYWIAMNVGLSTGSTSNTVSFRFNTMQVETDYMALYHSIGTSGGTTFTSSNGGNIVWVSDGTGGMAAPGSQLLASGLPGNNPGVQRNGISPNYASLTNTRMPMFGFCT